MHLSRLLACLCLLPLLSRSAPTVLRAPEPDDPLRAHAWRLDNGLEVWLTVNRESPRFYAEIAVRAGSKNDPADCTGLAHYLEHLLFKGSTRLGTLDAEKEKPLLDQIEALYEQHFAETNEAKRAEIYARINEVSTAAAAFAVPNEFDTLYHAMGASDVNAHTSVEETVYKATLPSSRLKAWAKVEADRFAQPVFRLFHTELETVYEEKNRALDDRQSLVYEAVDRLLFPVHPYGRQTTLGEAEHLKRPSLTRIRQFYDTWYVPANMAILISGDLDPKEAIRVIDGAFSAWKPGPVPEPTLWLDPGPAREERVAVTYPGEESVQIAFRTVPAGHPDEDALVMLDLLLDNRVAGLINLNLNQAQRVNAAGSHPEFMRDAGVHRLWGVPKDGQTPEQVEKLLLEQLALARSGTFDESLLPAIVADLRREEMRRLESNESRVELLRQAFILGQDPLRAATRLDRLAKVTAADIVRVANAHYAGPKVVGVVRDGARVAPVIAKPRIDPLDIPEGRRSAFGAEILALPAGKPSLRPLRAGQEYQALDRGGRRLLRVPNPMNGLFTLTLVLDAGSVDLPLLPYALRLVEKCGAGSIPSDKLPLEWYRLGAEWSYEVDDFETTLTLTGLDTSFDAALALLNRQLREPWPDARTWPDLRGIVRRERADARKDPDQIFQALVEFQRYGPGSAYLREPPLAALDRVTDRELLKQVTSLLNRPSRTGYTGAVEAGPLADALAAALLPPLDGETLVIRPSLTPRSPATNEVWLVRQDTAQTSLCVSVADGGYQEARVAPSQAFNSYFGTGMASLVFQQIREARALAYSAWAAYIPARGPHQHTFFTAQLGTQCDKTLDALDALSTLIRDMPVSDDRFAQARAGVISQYVSNPPTFREIPGVLLRWQGLGLAADPRPKRLKTLEGLTTAKIADFMKERVVARPWSIALCGDTAQFDATALARFGAVREVKVPELFAE